MPTKNDNNTLQLTGTVELQAAAAEGQRPKLMIAAYNGGVMSHTNFYNPVIVDLAGLKPLRARVPLLMEHDPSRIVGMSDAEGGIVIDPTAGVRVNGSVTGDDADATNVLGHAKNGFEWQASLGVNVTRREFLEPGKTAKVNGRDVVGPLIIARAGELKEVSLCACGADHTTSATVAASSNARKDTNMEFAQWLEAKGFNHDSLTEGQRATLQAAYAAESAPTPTAPPNGLDAIFASQREETARQAKITEMTHAVISDPSQFLTASQVAEIETLSRLAMTSKWNTDKYELELLRATRAAKYTPTRGGSQDQPAAEIVEAALALSIGMDKPERHYSEQTLNAAHKRYRHGLGLKEVLLMAAKQRGENHDLGTRNIKALLKAAFRERDDSSYLRAASPYSTLSLPTTFSNIANKTAVDAFNHVEQVWRNISVQVPVSDFKETTQISLTGNLTFEKIGPTGELKHGTLGEEVYHNQAETYGKLLGLDRRDIINDDAGALNRLPKRIGRGGALALNTEFWTVWQAARTAGFFSSGNGNYDTGTDTTFGADGLVAADILWRAMTDPDLNSMGTTAKILLVPSALRIPAMRLMNSQHVLTASDAGDANPWAGAYQVESSTYLSAAKVWWMLADPQDLPAIEVAFLNGQQTPMIETAEPTPDYLGIIYQAIFDFGVAMQEPRAAYEFKGEN